MAALQKIRNRAGLLIGALGIALLAFVLGDLFTSGGAWVSKFKNNAFYVDGENVPIEKYFNRVNQFEEFQKFISGRSSLDENITDQIREYVYDQMVREIILDEQAEKLGLGVSKEELNDMVHGENISPVLLQSPLFVDPQTGQFSRDGLNQFLAFIQTDVSGMPQEQRAYIQSYKEQWMVLESMMKYRRLEEKYNALVMGTLSANNVEVKASYDDSNYASEIAYAVKRYNSVPDSTVSVSQSEIDKLYKERRNNYKLTSELRKVSYVIKDVVPSEEDFASVEREINQVRDQLRDTPNPALLVADHSEVPYQNFFFAESSLSPEEKRFAETSEVGDIYGPIRDGEAYNLYKLVDKTQAPDSVRLSIIIIPEGVDKEFTENTVDSVLSVIKGGKSFAEVAEEIQPGSNGGEIGWATEPMIASAGEDFIRKVFEASTGEVLKFNMRGQYQLVRVEEKTTPVTKYKLALVRMSVPVSDRTLTSLDSELNQLVDEAGGATKFAEVAAEKGYTVIPEMTIRPSDVTVGQVTGARQIVHWAFNEKVGSIKKFDLSDKRVVAVVNSKVDGDYLPLAEVSASLKAELIRQKKAEKLVSDLSSKNISSLDAYAQEMSSRVDTARFVNFNTTNVSGLGRESVMNVYSKVGEVNKLQGPVKGDIGVYVLSIQNREDQNTEYNPEVLRQGIEQRNMYRVSSGIMRTLMDKMDVKDNRVKFF